MSNLIITLQHGRKEQQQMGYNEEHGHGNEEDAQSPPFALQCRGVPFPARVAVVAHHGLVVLPQVTVWVVCVQNIFLQPKCCIHVLHSTYCRWPAASTLPYQPMHTCITNIIHFIIWTYVIFHYLMMVYYLLPISEL